MIKKLAWTFLLCMVFFLLLEGLCSALVVAYDMVAPDEQRALAAPAIRYDSQLGWASVPNYHEQSYYAPGIYLTTNSAGFRTSHEFTPQVPPGKLRIICSGDSQTFGDGVDNDHTFCQLLESIDPRLQTVNTATIGWGVDQMFLRYRRDALRFDHNIHLFAFVTDDFRRMNLTSLLGYQKPRLRVRNGELVTENVPVPRTSAATHWFALKPNPLREFKFVALATTALGHVLPPRDGVITNGPSDQQRVVLDRMIATLVDDSRQKSALLAFVYLPRGSEYDPNGPSLGWRKWLREESAKRGFAFIDLVGDFQKLRVTTRDGMFIWPGSVENFVETPGHYSEQGHEYVARALYNQLIALPRVAEDLRRLNNPGLAVPEGQDRELN